jgi:hypothetical protein
MDEEGPGWASEPVVRAVLAFAGVPGIILALAGLYAATQDIARVDALSRVLQGAMLAIIGFYFGRVDVGRAYREAERARKDMGAVRDRAVAVSDAVQRTTERAERAERILELAETDRILRERIEELSRRRGEG